MKKGSRFRVQRLGLRTPCYDHTGRLKKLAEIVRCQAKEFYLNKKQASGVGLQEKLKGGKDHYASIHTFRNARARVGKLP